MCDIFLEIGEDHIGKWHIEDSHRYLIDPPRDKHEEDRLGREYSGKSNEEKNSWIYPLRDDIRESRGKPEWFFLILIPSKNPHIEIFREEKCEKRCDRDTDRERKYRIIGFANTRIGTWIPREHSGEKGKNRPKYEWQESEKYELFREVDRVDFRDDICRDEDKRESKYGKRYMSLEEKRKGLHTEEIAREDCTDIDRQCDKDFCIVHKNFKLLLETSYLYWILFLTLLLICSVQCETGSDTQTAYGISRARTRIERVCLRERIFWLSTHLWQWVNLLIRSCGYQTNLSRESSLDIVLDTK